LSVDRFVNIFHPSSSPWHCSVRNASRWINRR